MDLGEMTDEELTTLQAKLADELTRRQQQSESRAAVIGALRRYAETLGVSEHQAWKAIEPEGSTSEEPAPVPDAPDFVQPTGAHDAYARGDLITFNGVVYRSRADSNVWSPVAYPQGWEKL